MVLNYLASMSHYVPELLASLTMVCLIITEATYGRSSEKRFWVHFVGFIGLVATFVSLMLEMHGQPIMIFTNAVTIDNFSTLAKGIMVLGTIGTLYLSIVSKDIADDLKAEFAILTTGVLVGGMLLASANNMLILYIGIETLSILSYALASLKKNDERSSEAGLKYVLYGGVTAGLMLFGMSHIFGVLGTINFGEIAIGMKDLTSSQTAVLMPSFLLFFVGIGYKIACAPFHMWAPDVYEGAPIPVTAFFSIVPKIAGMACLVRITMGFFATGSALSVTWIGLILLIACITMTVGNISAINQRSVKRMLEFSSIGHAGVMMLGVVVADDLGVRAILFYGVTYLFMTLVAFYITSFVADQYGNDHFDRFSGLAKKHPLMAIIMIVVMFSLAGIPPLSGFVAKFHILAVIIKQGHYIPALIAGMNSVISLYYYMKIVRFMVFKDAESDELIERFSFQNQLVVSALALPVLVLGIFWSDLMTMASGAKLFF